MKLGAVEGPHLGLDMEFAASILVMVGSDFLYDSPCGSRSDFLPVFGAIGLGV